MQNNFFVEKNPTIVNFPVKNLELRDILPIPPGAPKVRLGLAARRAPRRARSSLRAGTRGCPCCAVLRPMAQTRQAASAASPGSGGTH